MTNNETTLFAALKILVAEDNPAVAAFIERALQMRGATVTLAEDGQQALDRLASQSFDVLVTDIVMPHVDGIALALTATRQYPLMKIIMISGYPQERMRAHNLDALVHRIIAKPFSLEEITEAVRDVLTAPQEPFD
ncbi:MAG: response regulator [Alphaproteobacteria bacterium]|nr:response regulator [Alphaproteobacteria bacterium]